MANVNVTLFIRYNQELGTTTAILDPSNPTIYRGDTLVLTLQPQLDASSYVNGVLLYAWDADKWTDSSNAGIFAWGNSITKIARSDAVFGNDQLAIDVYKSNGNAYVEVGIPISAPIDTTPDPFDLGPNISGVQPADRFYASLVTISGITTGVSATVSTTGGSALFTVNNGLGQTSATVTNGQKIQVYGDASSSYSSSITVTLTIGGVSASFVVTTTSTPPAESLIPFPVTSGQVALSQVKAFYGGTDPTLNTIPPSNMRSYLKGAGYVPNISQNSNIPSSGSVALTQFRGSYTTLYFTKLPRSISKNIYTGGGSVTSSQTWSLGTSGDDKFDVGFGPGMRGAVDFSYSIVQDTGSGKSTGVTLVVASGGSADVYNPGNNYVTVQAPLVTGNSEARYSGTLSINVRSKFSPYPVRTVTCKYFFNFYGV